MRRAATRFGYSIGPFGLGIIGVPMAMFMMIYMTDTLRISAVVAGIIMAIPKVWDVFIDIPVGGLCDTISHRFGGRWPLILVGVVGFPLALVAIYGAAFLGSVWVAGVTIAVALTFNSTLTTVFLVGHTALADDMEADPAARTGLLGARNIASTLGAIGASIAAPQVLAWGGGDRAGYAIMALIFAGIGIGPLVVMLVLTGRVPIGAGSAKREALPLLEAVRTTIDNKAFYALFFVLLLSGIVSAFLNTIFPYSNRYLVGGGPDLLSELYTSVLVTTILGIPVMTWISARIGPTRALQLATWSMVIAVGGFYAATFLPPWATVAAGAFAGLSSGGYALLIQSATIDAAKMPHKGVAVDSIGVYLGILFAGTKIGDTIGGLLCGFLVDLSGASPDAAMTDMGREIFRTGFGLLPLVLTIVSLPLLRRAGSASEPPADRAALAVE
ncbi:MAG TPA: MFS transporter [Aliidongia sp.]|uniref:MFS transporter n=1 Tax=Aliidongia sp. TaxID=1914230 RepID=UPI002DDD79D2|nr:MFS transporter [Aliidongia sp.]HEV2676066.1 MFS transporter [Aliidongia sp.]